MALRAMDLYDAYDKNMLPKEEGYIVSAFFNNDSPYSVIEVVSYAEVKSFHADKNSQTPSVSWLTVLHFVKKLWSRDQFIPVKHADHFLSGVEHNQIQNGKIGNKWIFKLFINYLIRAQEL